MLGPAGAPRQESEGATTAWWVVSVVLVLGLLGAVFGAAGRLDWPGGWSYLTVLGLALALHRAWVARHNPALLRRRRRVGSGAKAWDMLWNVVYWPLMLSVPLVAAIDLVRLGGTPMPAGAWLGGALGLGAGIALSAWAMGANPYFEGLVRVESGQQVVDAGPYRHVRHPGYAGLILWALSTPVLLRSWWALVPALAVAGWVVARTALEDATLRRELPGYEQYAARVPRRLIPGVW
jgi:protein-S-isoprenylcysteine O-methyltransferase Ste14